MPSYEELEQRAAATALALAQDEAIEPKIRLEAVNMCMGIAHQLRQIEAQAEQLKRMGAQPQNPEPTSPGPRRIITPRPSA